MPLEGLPHRESSHFMSAKEVIQMATTFVKLGVTKIRITGGEPLVNKDIAIILKELSALPVELALSTNGILLDKHFELLQSIRLKKLNISLDSLKEDVFNTLTRRNYFHQIKSNIDKAIALGFNVQINMVVIKGVNDKEVIDFVEWTRHQSISIRFIEFMPFDENQWNWEKVISQKSLLETLQHHFSNTTLVKLKDAKNATSKNYALAQFKGSFGFISTITQPFCDTCNRIRLTADGRIKNCLFSNEETDLLTALRKGENIESLILSSILNKHAKHAGIDFNNSNTIHKHRTMTAIGG